MKTKTLLNSLLLENGMDYIDQNYILVEKQNYIPKKKIRIPKFIITIVLLLLLLLNPYNVGTAGRADYMFQRNIEIINWQKEKNDEIVNNNIFFLKNTHFSQEDINILNNLLDPIIRPIVNEYKDNFLYPDTVINVIKTLATSEGSSSDGHPFGSNIWRKDNNPFGIKGGGNIYNTTEEFNGTLYEMRLSFAKFETFQHAIRYITKTMFVDMPTYKGVRTGITGAEIFQSLEDCHYFTSTRWREAYLVPTYYKYCALSKK